jgi:SAM-dependent methyltransferase
MKLYVMKPEKFASQINYWNEHGSTKTFQHPVNYDLLNNLLPRHARILDYGCGYGRVCKSLYDNNYKNVIGVDFSPRMIEYGCSLYPELSLDVINSLPLNYCDREFDAIFLFAVLTCIPDNQVQIELIAEIKRVLRDDGLLYISDLCLQSDERYLQCYRDFYEKYGIYGVFEIADGAVMRHHEKQWIKSLTSGFVEFAFEEFDVVTMNKHKAKAFQLFARKKT